jgi:ComF family protein
MVGQYIEPMSLPMDVALPGQCAACRSWDRGRICRSCIARFAVALPRCPRCALPLVRAMTPCAACLRAPPSFDDAVAAVDYAFPWDRLLARFKFGAELDLAGALASLLDAALRRHGEPPPDLVLPVPLSAAHARERGFNQAWEIARRLRRRARADLLLRVRDTPHQLALPRARREANVRDAFAIEPRLARCVRDADVAVVDDVMTTGATASELARTLRRAGARRIRAWVVARTPAPPDE